MHTTVLDTQPPASAHRHADDVGGTQCLTFDLTAFLLGRVSMDEVCQFCVLDALAPLHPWQMSVYTVGSDSLFRLVGAFGRGPGQDVLHQYSCLDEPHVGESLRHGFPLANFPLIGMRPEQRLAITDLGDGPQVLWPLTTAKSLTGVMHVRFTTAPGSQEASTALNAIAGPMALAIELAHGRDNRLDGRVPGNGPTHGNHIPSSSHASSNGVASSNHGSANHATAPGVSAGSDGERPESPMTPRQMRVLALMSKGMTNAQIARILAFSESTVRQETMAIYRNLKVKGRAEAVEEGRARGMIPPVSIA